MYGKNFYIKNSLFSKSSFQLYICNIISWEELLSKVHFTSNWQTIFMSKAPNNIKQILI